MAIKIVIAAIGGYLLFWLVAIPVMVAATWPRFLHIAALHQAVSVFGLVLLCLCVYPWWLMARAAFARHETT